MPTSVENLIEACRVSWWEENLPGKPNVINCSGFLRSVSIHLHKPFMGAQADDLIGDMQGHWTTVSAPSVAPQLASQGVQVVAGLKGAEHTPPRSSGHVAVIVPGLLYHGKYPLCWCGSSSTAQSRGDKSVGEVWNRTDRDKVHYFRAI